MGRRWGNTRKEKGSNFRKKQRKKGKEKEKGGDEELIGKRER